MGRRFFAFGSGGTAATRVARSRGNAALTREIGGIAVRRLAMGPGATRPASGLIVLAIAHTAPSDVRTSRPAIHRGCDGRRALPRGRFMPDFPLATVAPHYMNQL